MNTLISKLGWVLFSLTGASAFGVIALQRGESIGAIWIVIAAVCVYLIAFRFYSLFIANRVLKLDATRMTPAFKHNDGLDHVPTNKYVLFGHHFAAIAGAGPLVGPILAAQMGYLPGMLWLLAGVVFAGAVQDFIVHFHAAQWPVTGRSDQVRTGAIARYDCDVRNIFHHADFTGRIVIDCSQGAG